MTDLATDTFDSSEAERQAIIDLIQSRPQWQQEYEQLASEISGLETKPRRLEISVYREEKLIGTTVLEKIPGSQTIDKITPGCYTVSLATGRVIWQGELTEQDLIWRAAFPGEPVDLAADTGGAASKSTRQFKLLDGEMTLRVFAGLESGKLEIIVNGPEES